MVKFKRITATLLAIGWLFSCLVPAMASTDKVNINTASKEQLVTLKHIGEKLADKIIEYRKAHPFQAPEDIMNVKGIGEKVFNANKDRIIVKDAG